MSKNIERICLGKVLPEDQRFLESLKIALLTTNATELLNEVIIYLSKLPLETISLCISRIQCEPINIHILSQIKGEEIPLKTKGSLFYSSYL